MSLAKIVPNNEMIHHAIINNDIGLLDYLLQQSDVDIDYKNSEGETPLLFSIRTSGSEIFIMKLINAGANLDSVDCYGRTCLHLAVLKSSLNIIHILIKKGANLNAQTNLLWSPLHYAVQRNNLELVCMLLYYNIDVTALCEYNMTAFSYALHHNKFEIADVLFDYYNEFNSEDWYEALNFANWNKLPIMFGLIDKVDDIIDEEALLNSLNYSYADLFKLIWSEMDVSILLHRDEPFFVTFARNAAFVKEDWIECVYMILESPLASEFILYSKMASYKQDLFLFLLEAFYKLDVDLNNRISIIYACLSLGCEVNARSINFASMVYNSKEEIEMIVYAGNYHFRRNDLEQPQIDILLPQPRFIFEVKCDPDIDEVVELFKIQLRDVRYNFSEIDMYNIIKTLGYFSISFHKKQDLIKYCKSYVQSDMNGEILTRIEHLPETPSLLELSRNVVRKCIQRHYVIKTPYNFLDIVKKMIIPQRLKDILTFKTPLY